MGYGWGTGHEAGRKLRQEDFCQLAEKSPKEKYDGSAELCARLVRRYADEPGIELWKLYRLTLFSCGSATETHT
jgi:serine/threonine-protein kinase HipA